MESEMAGRKGPLEKLAEAVEEVVVAVTVSTGLAPEPEPKSKTARKAKRKAAIARAEEAKKAAHWKKRR